MSDADPQQTPNLPGCSTAPRRWTPGISRVGEKFELLLGRNSLVTLSGYGRNMSPTFLARYVSPWALKRDKAHQQQVAALRERDGDNCRRCRRPIHFDLPRGHDKGPAVESFVSTSDGESQALENLCLCHSRCNAAGEDHTDEVTERIRRRNEAALFAKPRRKAARR
jgi:5-methylcytosine-specific restriction endonuclease McrA